MNKIIHFLSLSGVGGVQKQFSDHYAIAKENSKLFHVVYSTTNVEKEFYGVYIYKTHRKILDRIWLIYNFVNSKTIIHYYNNLGSKSLNKILNRLPINKVLLHEHGTIWNASIDEKTIYQENIMKSSFVIVNSNATKIMLNKKFEVPLEKIKIVYNGIPFVKLKNKIKTNTTKKVGYIGRLDSHKGVHVLISSAKLLESENIEFLIAGTGNYENELKEKAKNLKNIKFIGRVHEPHDFISKLDILVVPSIREPLGNVILEAGLCKVPVIASNIDGIPEIIIDKNHGVLLDAKNDISIFLNEKASQTFPKLVVDPTSKELIKPMEIDPQELAFNIVNLLNNNEKSEFLANNLYKRVINSFLIENYNSELEKIYNDLLY